MVLRQRLAAPEGGGADPRRAAVFVVDRFRPLPDRNAAGLEVVVDEAPAQEGVGLLIGEPVQQELDLLCARREVLQDLLVARREDREGVPGLEAESDVRGTRREGELVGREDPPATVANPLLESHRVVAPGLDCAVDPDRAAAPPQGAFLDGGAVDQDAPGEGLTVHRVVVGDADGAAVRVLLAVLRRGAGDPRRMDGPEAGRALGQRRTAVGAAEVAPGDHLVVGAERERLVGDERDHGGVLTPRERARDRFLRRLPGRLAERESRLHRGVVHRLVEGHHDLGIRLHVDGAVLGREARDGGLDRREAPAVVGVEHSVRGGGQA